VHLACLQPQLDPKLVESLQATLSDNVLRQVASVLQKSATAPGAPGSALQTLIAAFNTYSQQVVTDRTGTVLLW